MNKQDSPVKKFLKQVGNIVAVQALAGSLTELGKVAWPKVKEKMNAVLNKVDDFNKSKQDRQALNNLVKDSAAHYKKAKETLVTKPTPPPPVPPVEPDPTPNN